MYKYIVCINCIVQCIGLTRLSGNEINFCPNLQKNYLLSYQNLSNILQNLDYYIRFQFLEAKPVTS